MATTNDSSFKVKAAPVNSISGLANEPGAIVYNKADGFVYVCDGEGWKKLNGTLIP